LNSKEKTKPFFQEEMKNLFGALKLYDKSRLFRESFLEKFIFDDEIMMIFFFLDCILERNN